MQDGQYPASESRTTEKRILRYPSFRKTRHSRCRSSLRMALPLSFRSCVPVREIRLCDVDGVSDFFSVPSAAFGCGSAGCPLAALTVSGQGDDRGGQAGQRVIRAAAAVPAGGFGGDVGADEAEDGGERD